MRTTCFCGFGGGVGYTPRYPTPQYTLLPISYLPPPRTLPPGFPTPRYPPKGHGTGDTLPPGKDMGPEIPYPQKGHRTRDTPPLWKGHGARDTLPPCEQNENITFPGGKNSKVYIRIWTVCYEYVSSQLDIKRMYFGIQKRRRMWKRHLRQLGLHEINERNKWAHKCLQGLLSKYDQIEWTRVTIYLSARINHKEAWGFIHCISLMEMIQATVYFLSLFCLGKKKWECPSFPPFRSCETRGQR